MRAPSPALASAAVVTAVSAVVPLFVNYYLLSILFAVLFYIVAAASWNLPGGYGGQFSFGHFAFVGLGAYTAGLMVTYFGVSNYWSPLAVGGVLAGAALSAATAGGLTFMALPLRGAYFAIATLAAAELASLLIIALKFTGGSFGVALPAPKNIALVAYPSYYMMLALAVMGILTTYHLARSKFGLALKCIKLDEEAAEAYGIDTRLYRTLVMVAGGAIAGAAGAVFAYNTEFINTTSVFNITLNLEMMFMTILGGSGTVLSPVIGGVVVSLLDNLVVVAYPFIHLLIVGILLTVMVLFFPGGIPEFVNKRLKNRKKPV